MDILVDMGVSKLSAKVFFFSKVNYSFKGHSLFKEWKWIKPKKNQKNKREDREYVDLRADQLQFEEVSVV